MRVLKFSKEDLIIDIDVQNGRLEALSKLSEPLRAYGMHETPYEIWVFLEPSNEGELSFFQQVNVSDDQAFEATVRSYWQGSQLLLATASLDDHVNISLIRKLYA